MSKNLKGRREGIAIEKLLLPHGSLMDSLARVVIRSYSMKFLERRHIHPKVVICDVNTSIEAVTAAGALGCI
nr:hypothetical protein [Tanacetum cinerariifolium]